MPITLNRATIKKFDVAGPRYTSYPTAPIWNNSFNDDDYRNHLRAFGQSDKTLSLYVHIPFCEELCYFCACNMMIRRKDDKYGDEYLAYLFKEIDLVVEAIERKARVKQLHWGGGTPTFLSNSQIEKLSKKIQTSFEVDTSSEIAIEIDPRTIDHEKLMVLRQCGFNRVSMGVQDFDRDVQQTINRVQPFAMVEQAYYWCRELKFNSINFDLIYGLPNQTPKTFQKTIQKVIQLKPDRIALYSFAYLPWMRKHGSKIEEKNMPSSNDKVDIFLDARTALMHAGYKAIAMDHFAIEQDELAVAFQENRLYRNFMGYTVKPADEYIGVGVSSIGFIENAYAQNTKIIKEYYASLDRCCLPIERGKKLTEDDCLRQWVINQLMCHFHVDKIQAKAEFNINFDEYFSEEKKHILDCVDQGLLLLEDDKIYVTELGKLFIRNICMGFDWYLRQQGAHTKFSKTV